MANSTTLSSRMTTCPENNRRRRTLFVSYLYPSFFGTGSQIRAAALLHMLAAREDVYLLVILPHGKIPAARDVETDKLCKEIEFISLLPNGNEDGIAAEGMAANLMPSHEAARLSIPIQRFCDENNLDSLFVYRFESCLLVNDLVERFPRRYLDLDELASRRIGNLDQLKTISSATTTEASDRRLQMALRMMEKKFVQRFEKIFASSEIEAEAARCLTGHPQVDVLPNIAPPRTKLPPAPVTEPREILFVGALAHFPNVDALLYFHREVFPLIQKQLDLPVLFRVVGEPISDLLQELAKDPDVRLMGHQMDLDPFYAAASLALVPLRAGAGTRIKILEAFAYGRPVVSTRIGAQGLAVTDGENILLADNPADFAQACTKVLADTTLSVRLVENAEAFYREHHSLETLVRCYDEVVDG
jgi:glycosyltransferase involved in cell wall biosynthesis